VWCWDNLSIRLAPELAEFAAEMIDGCVAGTGLTAEPW
jgi:hypothetical protein